MDISTSTINLETISIRTKTIYESNKYDIFVLIKLVQSAHRFSIMVLGFSGKVFLICCFAALEWCTALRYSHRAVHSLQCNLNTLKDLTAMWNLKKYGQGATTRYGLEQVRFFVIFVEYISFCHCM